MSALAERIFAEVREEGARRSAKEFFPALPEIPGGRYTQQDFFDLEIRRVFSRSWLMVGHVGELAGTGSFKTFAKIPAAPILIVRGRDGEIRAFYNTCRHRGAPVVKGQSGRCNILRCQYHSWAYDLDGHLVQVPDEYEFPGLDRDMRGLLPVRCETFCGLIFVNLDRDAMPLRTWLGPLAKEWAATGLASRIVDYHWNRVVQCNWKCAVDAFQEIYHINTLHPQTVGTQLDRSAAAIELLPNGHSRMCVRLTSAEVDTAPAGGWSLDELYQRTSVAHTMWPSLIVPWQTGGAKFILFWPRSPGRCEIEVLGVGAPWGEGAAPDERKAGQAVFDGVLMEDVENLEAIQASLESEAFTGMLLGHQERRIYWSHEQIDRAIGAANIPSGLAVVPLLEPFVVQDTVAASSPIAFSSAEAT